MRTSRAVVSAIAMAGLALAIAPDVAQGQRRQRDRITREEIMESAQRDMDLFQAVKALRPRFLEGPRGARSFGNSTPPNPIMVVVDKKRIGGIESLQSIRASDVQEVRHLDPTRSENEYGPSGNGGAIVITLVKAPAAAVPPKTTPPPTTPPPTPLD